MGRVRLAANYLRSHLVKNFWEEVQYSFGEMNPQMTFYVIRRNSAKAGLFSYYTYVLGHIKYALNKGWIPIVDMQHYDNPYLDRKTIGVKNAWDYYFCQPCNDITLSEVYKSKNVILSSSIVIQDMPQISMSYFNNPQCISEWKELALKHVPCNKYVDRLVDEESKRQHIDFDKTLGVMLRGTDYLILKPKNHPIQPTIDEAIKEIDYLLDYYHCTSIFLSTEDNKILDEIVNKYGNKVKYCNVPRYRNYTNGYLSDIGFNRRDDAYQKGIDYIVPICILSRCRYLFAGRTSGSVAIPLLSKDSQKATFWDNGLY